MSYTFWVADFEATTDENDCRVWLWGLCPVELGSSQRVTYGLNIDSFFKRMTFSNMYVYFHNLAYDGVFILDALFRAGFRWSSERNLRSGQFSTLIDKAGKFFSITVRWRNGVTTEFRDSLKRLPMSLSKVAESYGQNYGKGELDYHTHRPVGHEPTSDELDYLERDVRILSNALAVQASEGMSKLTVGADALAMYKDTVGSKWFRTMFPILSEATDANIRMAYRGGWTYRNKAVPMKVLGPGTVFDVNSLYPYIMRTALLPYGEPVFSEDFPEHNDDYPLFVTCLTFIAKIKPDHVPCIQVKGSSRFLPTEYVDNIKEPVTLAMTNVDLDLWNDHYDVDVLSCEGTWYFKGLEGLFNEYIDHWADIKATSEGGRRDIAKLFLNSLYGKFATNPDVTGKVPVMDNDRVAFVVGEPETREPVYTPMGVFITAYARSLTIRAAQAHYDTFIYADTDSLHLASLDTHSDLDVDPHRMGAWKREYVFDQAYYARAKAYTTRTGREWSTHIAGLPSNVADSVRFSHYMRGAVLHGKLVPKRVPGGVVLQDTSFRLDKLT